MKNRVLTQATLIVLCFVNTIVSAEAILHWKPLGGGLSTPYLVAGQTYELHAIGLDGAIEGWMIDCAEGTSFFAAAAPATRPADESFSHVWNASDIPVSGNQTFFDTSVARQLIVNFMHDVNSGPDATLTQTDQYLCNITVGSTGIFKTNGALTTAMGQAILLGCELPVVASAKPVGDIDLDGYVDLHDFAIVAAHWLADNCTYPGNCNRADLDSSGDVNAMDTVLLSSRWLEQN